jgi:hypothetical protein
VSCGRLAIEKSGFHHVANPKGVLRVSSGAKPRTKKGFIAALEALRHPKSATPETPSKNGTQQPFWIAAGL